jgi:hypothetical protein
MDAVTAGRFERTQDLVSELEELSKAVGDNDRYRVLCRLSRITAMSASWLEDEATGGNTYLARKVTA